MKRFPSVTEVLQPFSGYGSVPESVLEAASARGTFVHAACAAIAKGEWLPRPPKEFGGYVASFRWWFERYVDDVLLVEEELTDPELEFIGHPDLLIVSKALGGIILPDIKTPLNQQKVWACQLAGYRRLVQVDRNIVPDRIGSLQLSPDGKPPKFHDYTHNPHYFNAFHAALVAWKFFNG